MFIKDECFKHPTGLSDLLLYFALVEDHILYLHDGALMAGWEYTCQDMDSVSPEDAAHLSYVLSSCLNLGSDWMVETNALRSPVQEYAPEGAFPDIATQLIDEERRIQFTAPNANFRSKYYLTLTYLPPRMKEQKIAQWFSSTPGEQVEVQKAALAKRSLEYFKSVLDQFESLFGGIFQIQRLQSVEMTDTAGRQWFDHRLLRYLRACITGDDFPFSRPRVPMYLNTLFNADLVPGVEPEIAGKQLRILAVDRYPAESWPGMFRVLEQCPFAYRWNTRTMLMDPEISKQLHDKNRRAWRGKERGLLAQFFNLKNSAVDTDAVQMSLEAQEAMSVAGRGDVQFGHYNARIILMDKDPLVLADRIDYITKVIQTTGFAFRIETVNAVDAWRGSLPGHGYSDLRQGLVHTLNVADGMPTSSAWTGLEFNPSSKMPPRTPPIFYAQTDGATPYRGHFHVDDNPHTAVFGPTGAGKSMFLAFTVAQWLRLPGATIFSFDKKAALYPLVHAARGTYYDFGGHYRKQRQRLCPLAHLEAPLDRAWAETWLTDLCEANALVIRPEHRNYISEGVRRLASGRNRSLTHFQSLVQQKEIQAALQLYTIGSAASEGLLDGESDDLHLSDFCVFEMEQLLGLDHRIVSATLTYLFRRINDRLDTRKPTLITVDEAWVALRHPLFREFLRTWLKELRKMNAMVLLATQNLDDVFKSEIKDVVLEQCATTVFLPNPKATSSSSAYEYYTQCGLSDAQIQQIARGVKKRDYYFSNAYGFRRIDLALKKVALAFLAELTTDQRELMNSMIAANPSSWQADWLAYKGLPDWAAHYRSYIKEVQSQEVRFACA
jgi:type IV secretion/conjugal transfer VirB4 family ATPase